MGTYIYEPLMGTLQKHGALAGLRRWTLERDDSGTIYPHRIYKDGRDNIYHSVTHILKETAPQEQKDALERWIERQGSADERDMACERGDLLTLMQNTYLKLERNLQDTMQTSVGYGEQDQMNWIAAPQRSRNGRYQKQPKPHRVLAGVRQATQEVYDHSYWNV